MIAILAAVFFGLALILELIGASIDVISGQVLIIAGLLCVALHLAGLGVRTGGWRRIHR